MNCKDKISNLCGTKTYAPCVFYASKLPEFSGITHDCVTIEDTTEDLYNILKDVREQLDLTSLGDSCLTYPLDSQGRITTNNVLSTLEEEYCNLRERVLEIETSGTPSTGGLNNLVDDTTPQLGGNLDLNGFSILGLTITESQISDFDSYQPKLTSGVNLKTINGISLLGSGNISTPGSGGVIDNLVSNSTTEPLSANQGRILKNTQDIQQSQININSAKVSNIPHPLVETAVPVGAIFTDTIYIKPISEPISYITGLQEALVWEEGIGSDSIQTFSGGNVASGDSTTSFGVGTTAHSFGEVSLGLFSTDYTALSQNTIESADRLVIIGNGISPSTKSDAVTILKNAQVGIDINNFEANTTGDKLQVNGDVLADGYKIPSGTDDDVLLGDGSTTSLAGIGGGSSTALTTTYNNTDSTLVSINVKEALDELDSKIVPPVTELLISSEITVSRDSLLIDADGLNVCTVDSAVTITVVDDATVNHPIGTLLMYKQNAKGTVTIVGDAGVTMPSYQTYLADDTITIRKVAADEWEFINPPRSPFSIATAEPTGFSAIGNVGTISQANYDAAVIASTTVATTAYLITP